MLRCNFLSGVMLGSRPAILQFLPEFAELLQRALPLVLLVVTGGTQKFQVVGIKPSAPIDLYRHNVVDLFPHTNNPFCPTTFTQPRLPRKFDLTQPPPCAGLIKRIVFLVICPPIVHFFARFFPKTQNISKSGKVCKAAFGALARAPAFSRNPRGGYEKMQVFRFFSAICLHYSMLQSHKIS